VAATHTLGAVRLLIFGGEACPQELVERLAVGQREVWNTYGPTETTVVACAARMYAGTPVRIGLPLDGWDLAVVDKEGGRVADGEVGELVIGGVGLARYLDETLSMQRFVPMPSLGWDRAYRSGDLVRPEPEGLVFVDRADDQVKVGGRRIELGEVDAALLGLDGIAGAAAAVRATAAGNRVLVGYVTLVHGTVLDRQAAVSALRTSLPAALVPLLAVVDDIPTRTSGKVDREGLPWPLASVPSGGAPFSPGLTRTARWLAGPWSRVLGMTGSEGGTDFFENGGGSLSAAQLVAALRKRYPQVAVADVYENPRLGQLAERLDELVPVGPSAQPTRNVVPLPARARLVQQVVSVALTFVTGARWLTWVAACANLFAIAGGPGWLPVTSWWWVLAGWLLLVSPWGRMGLTVVAARLLAGDQLVLTSDLTPVEVPGPGQVARIGCTLPEAITAMRPGDPVLIDDGAIEAVVELVTRGEATLRVVRTKPGGQRLGAEKGINLPDTVLPLTALTPEDNSHLPFVAAHADLVAISFVRTADDVQYVLERLEAAGASDLGLLLKIETRQGFENLPAILLMAMRHPRLGVMIARGDLAVEVGFERLSEVPRQILALCEAAHIPSIWATQVLGTLAKTGQPSRAEVTDAAAAQRAECVMLNKGPYILDAIAALDDILARMGQVQRKSRTLMRRIHSWDAQ
jgi:hypothetical protein